MAIVSAIERGLPAEEIVEKGGVKHMVKYMETCGCEALILGCTHFPHLKPLIEKICAGRAEVIDPSDAVARQARRVLSARGLLASASAKPSHVFIRT